MNSQCCWYGVYASVDACPTAIGGLRVDVTKGGYHQNVPAPGPFSTLMSGLFCEYGAGTYIVKLMRADGTVLCTKSVTTPSCSSANN
ncbi:MAG: hypothetical protein NTX15_11490 [Candidatus Kapabacteria bacterium]|nr:hypothetical protein [Candidatus Kapabacteria bacterium]